MIQKLFFFALCLTACTSATIKEDMRLNRRLSTYRTISLKVETENPDLKPLCAMIQKKLYESLQEKSKDPTWFGAVFGKEGDTRTGQLLLNVAVEGFKREGKALAPILVSHVSLADESREAELGKFTLTSRIDVSTESDELESRTAEITAGHVMRFLARKR